MTRLFPAVLPTVFLTLLLGTAGSAAAADGQSLYADKACTSCHGLGGEQPIAPQYPKLAGQNKAYLAQQMRDIKSGKRDNGLSMTMKPIMANVSDEEIEAIAEYLSSQ